MKTLKSIDPLTAGKVYAVLMAVIQLVMGVIAILARNTSLANYMVQMNSFAATDSGPLLMLTMSVVSGLVGGFIVGIIGAWLYSIIARFIGGIKVTLE